MINVSARNHKLVIDGLDCTSILVSADGGWSHYDQSGLAIISANFALKRSLGWTVSLDDRLNSRWARGKVLNLYIENSSKVLRLAPVLGHLYILNAEYDGISELKIEAGCILNLLNFRTPLGDGACFDLGTTTDLSAVAVGLLQKAGVPLFSVGINGAPLTVSLPKLSNESYIQLFGKLCWANGYIAYQTNSGVVTAKQVQVNPSVIHIKKVGVDEVRYDRLTGSEKPCEKIRVTGTVTKTKPVPNKNVLVDTAYGPISAVNPAANSSDSTILSQTTTTIELFFGERKRVVTTIKYEPIGKILPKRSYGMLDLIITEILKETSFYEQRQDYANVGEDNCNNPDEGKLTKIKSVTYRPFAVVLAEWLSLHPQLGVTNILDLITGKEEVTTYEYKVVKRQDQSTIIPTIKTISKAPAGAIIPEESFLSARAGYYVADLAIEEINCDTWRELYPEEWEYTSTKEQNLATAFPNVVNPPTKGDEKITVSPEVKLLLVRVSKKTNISNSGQATPPAPERFPPSHSIHTEQVKVEVNIPASFGSLFRPREREFSVEAGLLTSKSQAERIGRIEGHMLWGRYKGQSIGIPFGNELFNISPLDGSFWTDLSGSRYLFMVDGFSVALANNRFAAQFDGIWSGTVANNVTIIPDEPMPPGTVSPPYMLIQDAEIRVGWGFEVLDYPYSIEPVFIDAFIRSGVGFDMSPTVSVISGSGFNIKSVEGIDPGDSNVVDFRSGTGFGVRSFEGIDAECDAITLGSGNYFDIV